MANEPRSSIGKKLPRTPPNLRDEVGSLVSRAVDSVNGYEGEEYKDNRRAWVEMTSDRIMGAVMASLPSPIDIESKYELDTGGGVYVTVHSDQHQQTNNDQLTYLARFADDQGYNRYYQDFVAVLQKPYLQQARLSATVKDEGDN